MALQSPFFNKREPEVTPPAPNRYGPASTAVNAAPSAARGVAGDVAVGGSSPASAVNPAGQGSESKLTVGPNIKLKGVEITDCDTLVVEGSVEATMDSRVIKIAQHGAFKGAAEIDIAEIHGEFNGTLTVRQKLIIYSTGKVTGKIRYGKLVVEEGGQLSGEIEFGAVGSGAGTAAGSAAGASAGALPKMASNFAGIKAVA